MNNQLLVLCIVISILGTLRLGADTKNSDRLNANTSIVLEGTTDAQLALGVLEVDLRNGILDNGDTVIKIQRSLGLTIEARCDNNVEALLAQSSSSVGALNTLRVDNATLIVDLDISDFHLSRLVLATASNRLSSGPVVEDVVRQVVLKLGAVLLGDRADEDTITVEELQVDGVGVLVLGIVEENGVESGSASLVLLVDGGVDVVDC